MILQATKKMQDFIGVKTAEVPDETEQFQSWHANLFYLNRKKCLLLTHNESIYSLFLYNVSKKEVPTLTERIKEQLKEQMRRDDFTIAQIAYMVESLAEIRYAKTSDRRVLGYMNDMVHAVKWYAEYEGTVDVSDLNRRINETPYKKADYAYSKDELKHRLSNRCESRSNIGIQSLLSSIEKGLDDVQERKTKPIDHLWNEIDG